MKKRGIKELWMGSMLLAAFFLWTVLIKNADVQPIGVNGTVVGMASLNEWFHKITGVHLAIYTITDWLGLVPLFICVMFAGIGMLQLVKRRSLLKVDYDIVILGFYYIIVILCYLLFEMIPMNYRPILIEGVMEASYPSSTTLLVLCVMLTLIEQTNRRFQNKMVKRLIGIVTISDTFPLTSGNVIITLLTCGVGA